MRILSRITAGALTALVIGSAIILPAHAQEIDIPSSLTAIAAPVELKQLNGALITRIEIPEGSTAQDAATWSRQKGLRQILTVTAQEALCPPAQSGMATCMAIGFRTYQVRVTGATVINQKNRTPLQGSLEVGDHINAYGIVDSTNLMDAQIVRDLDKPLSMQPIQLDGLTVLGITQGKDGIQVDALRGSGPCWNYGATSRLAYPCPAGTQPAPTVRTAQDAYATADHFMIAVPRSASVLDANRRPIALSSISVGDTFNAYGTLSARGMMTAQVFRVTASTTGGSNAALKIKVSGGGAQLTQGRDINRIKLAVTGGTAPYRWRATGLPEGVQLQSPMSIECFVAPCPQPATDSAYLYGMPTQAGNFSAAIVVTDAKGSESLLTIPLSVAPSAAFQVSVKTDKTSYGANEKIGIDVTLANVSDKEQTATMSNGCQADYDVLPGFSLRTVQICTLSLGHVTLAPGETRTYHFDHDLSAHPLPKLAFPFILQVIGRVQNVGEASTTVTVKAAR